MIGGRKGNVVRITMQWSGVYFALRDICQLTVFCDVIYGDDIGGTVADKAATRPLFDHEL